ncbi:MAG: RsmB/NOP family class I SAM-dependent RNA methyltransferase [Candidatus Dojkabacteria bacterium]|nr:RsmB/NOP family class I SAM-dependent RNA methyltransferase [Candidatus Dojkabacteria bacterium]
MKRVSDTFYSKIEDFISKIKTIYSRQSEDILAYMYNPAKEVFRILNYADKNKVLNSLVKQGFNIKELFDFQKDINKQFYFVISNANGIKITDTPEFCNKDIYIQQASSALPVLALDLYKDNTILDLCAAPGSKAIQMYGYLDGYCKLYLVEKNRDRYFKMLKLLKDYKVHCFTSILIDGNKLYKSYPSLINYFDRVLVDAPCSNESNLVISKPSTFKYWSKTEPKKITKLQKGLINSGFKFLKKNGIMVYSTCTFSVEENEEVIDWFLEKNPSAKLLDFDLNIDNYIDGFVSYKGKKFKQLLTKTKRIIPNGVYTGFFIAKITKV